MRCVVLITDSRQDSEGWEKRSGLVSAETYGPAAQSSILHVLYSVGLTWRCTCADIRLDICHDGSIQEPSCYSASTPSNRFIAGSGDVLHPNVVVYIWYNIRPMPSGRSHRGIPLLPRLAHAHASNGEIMREESIS